MCDFTPGLENSIFISDNMRDVNYEQVKQAVFTTDWDLTPGCSFHVSPTLYLEVTQPVVFQKYILITY